MSSNETTSKTAATPRHRGGVVRHLRRPRDEDFGPTRALVGNRACRFDVLSYERLWDFVDRVAAGLHDLGIRKGRHVGLVAENSDLWFLSSLGLQSLGAVDVPRGGDAPQSEVQFCLEHSRCDAAIVQNKDQLEKLGALREKLSPVVLLEGEVPEDCVGFDALVERGEAALAKDPELLERCGDAIDADTLSTIIYTSGTTGNPKGVMLTHGNLMHNLRTVPQCIELKVGERFLSFLPSWHSFERLIEYVILDAGCELHYSSKRTLKADLEKVSPHFVVAVPRVYEIFARNTLDAVGKLNGLLGALVRGALSGSRVGCAAKRLARGLEVDRDGRIPKVGLVHRLGLELLSLLCAPAHLLADRTLYAKLRAAFGGSLHTAVSGGGPLPAHVDEFLVRAGVPLRNGYGLTETSPVVSVRDLRCNRLGTIGKPIAETEIRIVDEGGSPVPNGQSGVIEIRGPQVMQGYFENADATAFALREGGWFHSGDGGCLTAEGDIVINGRAKDTIVLSGGENIEPESMEAVLVSSPLIVEALVVGHGQKILGALLHPDLEAVGTRLGKDEPELRDSAVLDLLRQEVGRCISPARGFRSYERVGHVDLLDAPFSIEDGTLTPTLKKKRSVIEERHRDLIDGLFGPR